MGFADSIDLPKVPETSSLIDGQEASLRHDSTEAADALKDFQTQASLQEADNLESDLSRSILKRSRLRSYDSFLEPTVLPANDDDESIANLLSALKGRPRKRSYALVYPSLFCVAYAVFLYFEGSRLGQAGLTSVDLSIAGLCLLCIALYAARLAGALTGNADAQLATRCLIKIVSDLSDPDLVAARAGNTTSQQPNGQIDAVTSLLDSATAQASRIEALLKVERAKFEEVYAYNDVKLQNFVERLSSERAAIVTNAETVRSAIAGAHQNLSRDLDLAASRLSSLIASSSAGFATMLESQTARLSEAARESSDRCLSKLSCVLESASLQMSDKVDAGCQKFAASITEHGDHLDTKLTRQLKASSELLDRQIQDVQVKAAYRVDEMAAQLNHLLDRLDKGIGERGDKISSMLATRTIDIAQALREGEARFTETLDRTDSMSQVFLNSAQSVGEQMQTQTTRLQEGVVVPLKLVASALDEKGRDLSQGLITRFASIDEMLTTNAAKLTSTLDRETAALSLVLARSVESLSTVFGASQQDGMAARDYMHVLEHLLSERLSDFLASLTQSHGKLLAEIDARTLAIDTVLSRSPDEQKGPTLTAAPKVTRGEQRPDLAGATSRTEKPHERMAIHGAIENAKTALPVAADRSLANSLVGDARINSLKPASDPLPQHAIDKPSKPATNATWLTELLARASDEDADLKARPAKEVKNDAPLSFDTKEVDGFIKTEAFELAWQRYRNGDSGQAFLHIYTASGSDMRSKLRQQLARDTGLQNAVYNFMTEFEKLLRDTEADIDEDIFMEYISSNAGKIYTLLVDAAGRFG